MSKVTVTAKLSVNTSNARLAVDTDDTFPSPVYSEQVATANKVARLEVDGLTADTAYYCAVEVAGTLLTETIGEFTTPDSGAHSFKCAFAGDALTGSNEAVFDQIRAQSPLFFIHLGDMHYEDIDTDDPDLFRAAYDSVFAASKQHQLYREVPTVYMFDDHDYGPNDSGASSASRAAALQVYRERVPHHSLVETGEEDAVYHSFEVGRVVFIVTDQRSMASDKSDTDDASKTMLGSAQKTWFKNLIADAANEEKLFVWVCPRLFGRTQTAGNDSWGGYATERTELCDHIQQHASGRFCVLSADAHMLGIDDGTNHDFVTSGSEPIPTFQAAPLDHTSRSVPSGTSYSEGTPDTDNGQFGVMEVTDAGGASITVDWTGYDNAGNVLVTHQFVVSV